jgi:hypothetical protein
VGTNVVAIDVSKAFDGVDHTLLIQKIANSMLLSNIIRWQAAYIHGRQAVCLFCSVKSKACNIKLGVPQDGLLSPTLFNYFFSDFPDQASIRPSCADNFNNTDSSSDIPTLEAALNADLVHVSDWAEAKNLKLAPEKCVIILYTPWSKYLNLYFLNGCLVPLDRNPKYLGLYHDALNIYHKNADAAKVKASRAYQILKVLSGTSWGKNREMLIATYKTLVRPVLEYGAPIYYPNASATSINKKQVIQNNCLRLITGCHKKTHIDHLHQETKILKLENHNELLSYQFLVRTLIP